MHDEIGHFRPFSHINVSSFFSQKWLNVEKLWKVEQDKPIFPTYLDILVVDQDLSFKKCESYFLCFKQMSFDHGIHCPQIGALYIALCSAHVNSLCRVFPTL